MTDNFDIEIVPLEDLLEDGLAYAMHVQPPAFLGRPKFTVQLIKPALEKNVTDQLRRGEATPGQIMWVTEQVSRWLLNQELNQLLRDSLDRQQTRHSLRLRLRIDRTIRADFTDVPFELLGLDVEGSSRDNLLLDPGMASIVHLVPGDSVLPIRAAPLRILIIHSNPEDLGGLVPSADEVCADIKTLLPSDSVEIDLLSSKPGSDGPPTVEEVQKRLRDSPDYHIMVYLGHADVVKREDMILNVLYLERGNTFQELPAERLKAFCNVPLVLLVGCLTGTESKPLLKRIQRDLPNYMRGSQSAAQALVASRMGAEVAIGMRDRLEAKDAIIFLRTFFQSLLHDDPGNVELAVRAARDELASHPYAWSAPMIFRKNGDEPTFDFALHTVEEETDEFNWSSGRSLTSQEFLRANGFSEDGVQRFYIAKINNRHDWLVEEFIIHDAPLLDVANQERKQIANLVNNQSLIVFGPSGFGKTSHFFELSRLATTKSVLVVEVTDISSFIGQANFLEQYRDLIMDRALTELYKQLSDDPRQKTKYARWAKLKQERKSLLRLAALLEIFCEPGNTLPDNSLSSDDVQRGVTFFKNMKMREGYQMWIEILSQVSQSANFEAIYFLVDCVDEWHPRGNDDSKLVETLQSLLNPRVAQPGFNFACKFFLPEQLEGLMREKRLFERSQLQVYRMMEWSVRQLCILLEERIKLHSRFGNSADYKLAGFRDLCDPTTVPENICQTIAESLPQKSPSILFETVHKIIEYHCRQNSNPNVLISLQTIRDVLYPPQEEHVLAYGK